MDIHIKNLRLKFPEANVRQFTDLSISIEEGEKVLLLGPSGAGKSTLLNVLGGLIPKVIDVPLKSDRLEVPDTGAYVFQDPDSQFTMPTIIEELAFVLENQCIKKKDMLPMIEQALNKINLNAPLDSPINSLSGGMKQKLAIISCMLQGSEALFLDEPTSMLDEASAQNLWHTVQNIWAHKTVVIVEHRVNYIWDKVDRVILMNGEGEFIIDEPPEKLFNHYLNLLNDYGVWHPYSWYEAPVLKKIERSEEILLKIRNLEILRGNKKLLNIDNLNIYKGEWLTLEGENGTGKTSILLALMKLIKSKGSIIAGEKHVKKTKDIAGFMYPVFQNPELQFITNKVYDELFINLEAHYDSKTAEKRTQQLLEQMNLEHVSHLHPLEISTGQKRRLSVATATGGIPEIIILDEPTFGLDQTLTFRFIEMFYHLVQSGTTIIMITHDEAIKKRYPTRRLKIIDGTLTECGGGEGDATDY